MMFQSSWKKLIAGRFYWRELLSVLFILVALYFFRKERGEFDQVGEALSRIQLRWLLWGVLSAGVYIVLQGLMYVYSFRTVNARITLLSGIELYLKRNLIGIFLPAGGVTSQTFFKSIAERQHVSNTKTNFASFIFVAGGILSVVLVGIPVIGFLVLAKGMSGRAVYSFVGLVAVTGWLCWVSRSVYRRGKWYRLLVRVVPQAEVILSDLLTEKISARMLAVTLALSVAIEFTGICQLYVAMGAVAPDISFPAALLGYTVATILLVISPFLKGIGAIELSLIYILTLYGFDTTVAASVTLLYRFYNFWLVVAAGLASFLTSRSNLLVRVFPAFFIFMLGVVNVLSALSPAVHWRMRLITQYLPVGTVHLSNDLVVVAGVVLIVTSAFLLRGLRSAWIIAVSVSVLSVVANITKAIDYEEALFALAVCIMLVATRSGYQVKSKRTLVTIGVKVALSVWVTGVMFGIIGFYFMRRINFGVDLSLGQSIGHTLEGFLLLDTGLEPHTRFAAGFLRVINVMGIGSLAFLVYTVLHPLTYDRREVEGRLAFARSLVSRYGNSAADYFKTYPDKLIFTIPEVDGFIAYKTANDFALSLGMPVAGEDTGVYERLMDAFEQYGEQHGLKTAYYRVDERFIPLFRARRWRPLLIGQEAVVDLAGFSMEGKKRQSLRTARNNLVKKGYLCRVAEPPVPANIVQQLRAVSGDWLQRLGEEELVFSQGMFLEGEVMSHTVLYLEEPGGRIVAFLDLVPDYRPGEARYDLIRKLADAPGGCLDMLMVELIGYCRDRGFVRLNMGLAPMSGIEAPRDLGERTLKFAYEHIGRFRHYRGLRFFKEKFDPRWENKYLMYAHHFDLLLLPAALNKVMKAF